MSGEFIERETYVEASATASMRNVPRFGKSNDFSQLFESQDEATDYIVGLLFAGIMIFTIYFTWTIVLLVFKCLGQKRVGFLSGSPFVKKSSSSCCLSIYRVVYLLCAICLIIFSILFVTEGLMNLKTSIVTVIESARNVDGVMKDVDSVLDNVQSIGKNSTEVRDAFFSTLANGGQRCVQQQEEFGAGGGERNLTQVLETVKAALADLGDFDIPDVKELKNATAYFAETAGTIEQESEDIEIGDWQSLTVIIPYVIVPLILMVGVGLAHFGIKVPVWQCFLTWVIHPLFIIQVIFAYITASLILISASANADFCSGGEENLPDRTVENIMFSLGYSQEDLVYRIMVFYIGQCTKETPFEFLDVYKETIGDANALLVDFSDALTMAGTDALTEACNADVKAIEVLNAVILLNVKKLITSIQDMQEIISCDNIVELYTKPVYEGTCTYSITGVTWAWASFAAVGALGLIMIMLRSAWKIDKEDDVYAFGDNATIQGEFTVNQGLDGKTVDDAYTPYDANKDGDNPFEQTNAKSAELMEEAGNPSQQESNYPAGYTPSVADSEMYTESGMDYNNNKPAVPPSQY